MPESINRAADHAIDQVIRAHGDALERVAWGYVDNASDRDDLMQEILMALWRALPRFRGEATERTFVFRVAHNRALTHRFRRPPRGASLDEAVEVSDPSPSPEALAAADQQRQRLAAALRRLPVVLRQVLVLGLEGLSRGEMAEVLGTTENNATVRLSRARKALQKELETL